MSAAAVKTRRATRKKDVMRWVLARGWAGLAALAEAGDAAGLAAAGRGAAAAAAGAALLGFGTGVAGVSFCATAPLPLLLTAPAGPSAATARRTPAARLAT